MNKKRKYEVSLAKKIVRKLLTELKWLRKIDVVNKFYWENLQPPRYQGEEGVEKLGHREYVGGAWDEIGRHQYNFLIEHGLSSEDNFLDIGCGSLRLGSKLIGYLEEGKYFGIDKEEKLIKKGLDKEVEEKTIKQKSPRFVVSGDFEFEKFEKKFNVAWAQSLFTHLSNKYVHKCFRKLRPVMKTDGVFYATFFRSESESYNPPNPHDHLNFLYTVEEMKSFGRKNGFGVDYIGGWGHPRGQVIVRYDPK